MTAQELVHDWNRRVAVGDCVRFTGVDCRVASQAFLLQGEPAVCLVGVRGPVALRSVAPISRPTARPTTGLRVRALTSGRVAIEADGGQRLEISVAEGDDLVASWPTVARRAEGFERFSLKAPS
jgi:hypothetical protein